MTTALILGSTKGLGKEITSLCIKKNWNTVEIGSSISDAIDGKRNYLNCDLSSEDSVFNLIKKLESVPEIDYFFWIAGRIIKGDFSLQQPNDILNTIDINFRNAVPLVQYIWKRMQSTKEPSNIIAISSSSGLKPRPDEAIYAATKFAQVGFIKNLGLENKNPNLKILLVLPGGMKTSLWDKIPTPDYNSFLNPTHVADKIMDSILSQTGNYSELSIPRGSLK